MNLIRPHLVIKAMNRTVNEPLSQPHPMKEFFLGGRFEPVANYGLSTDNFLLNHLHPEKPRLLTEPPNGSRRDPSTSRRFQMGLAIGIGWS